MPKTTLKKSHRNAYARALAAAAIMLDSMNHLMLSWDTHFPQALTEEEKEYIAKLKTRIHKDGLLILKFSHKLRGPRDAW